MTTEFPDRGTIHAALSLAVRAPSMQNSQPWRWQVGPRALNLYADGGRDLADAGLGNRALVLSCGVALNHCVIGLAAFGWQSRIHRFPSVDDPEHLAAIRLHRFPAGEADVTLAAAIPRRRTDRRPYNAWPVPRGGVALMGARAARAGVTMRRVEAFGGLTSVPQRSAGDCANDGQSMREIATCRIHYDSRSLASVGKLSPAESAASVTAPVATGMAVRRIPDDRQGNDNSVMVALGTTCDDAMAHLRAGEATSVVLLTATALGLASCPVAEPLETVKSREMLREKIFQDSGFAQMLIRIGWAPVNADPLPPTPRHDFADVVEWLDDEGLPVTT